MRVKIWEDLPSKILGFFSRIAKTFSKFHYHSVLLGCCFCLVPYRKIIIYYYYYYKKTKQIIVHSLQNLGMFVVIYFIPSRSSCLVLFFHLKATSEEHICWHCESVRRLGLAQTGIQGCVSVTSYLQNRYKRGIDLYIKLSVRKPISAFPNCKTIPLMNINHSTSCCSFLLNKL